MDSAHSNVDIERKIQKIEKEKDEIITQFDELMKEIATINFCNGTAKINLLSNETGTTNRSFTIAGFSHLPKGNGWIPLTIKRIKDKEEFFGEIPFNIDGGPTLVMLHIDRLGNVGFVEHGHTSQGMNPKDEDFKQLFINKILQKILELELQ